MKSCRRCGAALTRENWYLAYERRGNKICRPCLAAVSKEYRQKHRDVLLAKMRANYRKNSCAYIARVAERRKVAPDVFRARDHHNLLGLKMAALTAYGGACVCCGVTDMEFLTIDHINGDGARHRRENGIKGAKMMYLWLKRSGYPKEGFRILCMNCNCARAWYGTCPHERVVSELA